MDERRDDWRRGVDENLASLNTGQRVTDRLLEDLDANYAALDRLLRGDAEKDTDGVIGRLHHLETQIAQLNSVIFMDAAGKHGLQHTVEKLLSGERTSDNRWKFATAVLIALIPVLGAVLLNWGRISAYFERTQKPAPLEQAIEHAKHPKGRKRYIIREIPAEEDSQ